MTDSTIINNPVFNVVVGEGSISVEVDHVLAPVGDALGDPWITKNVNFTAEYSQNYFIDPLALIDIYLPVTKITNRGFSLFLKSGGWIVRQRDLETIQVHDRMTTLGLLGLVSTNAIGSYTRFVYTDRGWLCFPNEPILIF